jgi:spore germination protein GerM
VLAGSALYLAACGIPTDHAPRTMARDAVPAALAPRGTTTTVEPGSAVSVTLYLIATTGGSQMLQPVTVQVQDAPNAKDLALTALQQLIEDQPATSATTAKYANLVPTSLKILGAKLDGGVLSLDLSSLDGVQNNQQRLVFAQVVFTATGISGINAVRFSLNGQPAQVQTDTATSQAGAPITPDDYPSLNPSG